VLCVDAIDHYQPVTVSELVVTLEAFGWLCCLLLTVYNLPFGEMLDTVYMSETGCSPLSMTVCFMIHVS
jgi:hypothetical protein